MNDIYYQTPFYETAFSFGKKYIKKKGYEITNFSLQQNSPNRVVFFVSENNEKINHIVFVKQSRSMFLIWSFNSNGEEIEHTSFDYAEVRN